jgi:hypothetical protein
MHAGQTRAGGLILGRLSRVLLSARVTQFAASRMEEVASNG